MGDEELSSTGACIRLEHKEDIRWNDKMHGRMHGAVGDFGK